MSQKYCFSKSGEHLPQPWRELERLEALLRRGSQEQERPEFQGLELEQEFLQVESRVWREAESFLRFPAFRQLRVVLQEQVLFHLEQVPQVYLQRPLGEWRVLPEPLDLPDWQVELVVSLLPLHHFRQGLEQEPLDPQAQEP